MEWSLIILVVCGIGACTLCLRFKDVIPMAVNLVLIGLGTWALLWMLTNPTEAQGLQEQITAAFNGNWLNVLIFVALQPLVFIAAKWIAKRGERFDHSRKVKDGQ